MKRVLVDTDAFSIIWQGVDDHLAQQLIGSMPILSFATVAELHYGAAKAGWGDRRVLALDEAVRRYVVAPYDQELARLWGRLKAQAQSAGHALGQTAQTNDLWICATAIRYEAPLLTLNRRHFDGFPGLVVLP
ncbi:type II toxin-antitoxin system VapC family toxin [Micromonospora sp. WMMD956]|uniref:type II toxin-antitoxin system VapC family toxin n=1 Tax=Micromonospora sp. WMMD956 TaxID=3016108 RepID=UPI00241599B7|nr:type II toxin-antitoxin system VapC family toxin [Micromonospora sp. WMMD956]MDG4818920.1 type II toxin-antitoxin system VapC family toxin [Micromonospora sp. WMMD956]